jgi:hypothetical protein
MAPGYPKIALAISLVTAGFVAAAAIAVGGLPSPSPALVAEAATPDIDIDVEIDIGFEPLPFEAPRVWRVEREAYEPQEEAAFEDPSVFSRVYSAGPAAALSTFHSR